MDYNKKFLILGNNNAITYKDVFPHIKNGEMWLGFSANKTMEFQGGDGYEKSYTVDNVTYCKIQSCSWFTNIPHNKNQEPFQLTKTYNPEEYPKYDNYDAIEVSKVKDIPIDYDGVMGVPITFLDKYCNSQFEIVGTSSAYDTMNLKKDYSEYIGTLQDGSLNGRNGSTFGCSPVLLIDDKVHPYYINKDGIKVQTTYFRIFIKKNAEFEIVWLASGHSKTTMPKDVANELNANFEMDARVKCGKGYAILNGEQLYHRLLIKRIK